MKLNSSNHNPSPSHEVRTVDCRLSTVDCSLSANLATTEQEVALLTTQYRKAVNGLYEAYRFGQMLAQVKARLEAAFGDAARGTAEISGGKNAIVGGWNAGTGLKAWLAEHCPEINYSTARRFLAIAEKTNLALAAQSTVDKSEHSEELCHRRQGAASRDGEADGTQGRDFNGSDGLSTSSASPVGCQLSTVDCEPSEQAVRDFLEGKSQRQVLKAPGKPTPRHAMSEEERAEKLAEVEDPVSAFHQLQKLHQEYRETGPVAKELREDLWNRFKEASTAVNKRHQAHFEGLKEQQEANLVAKTALCEKAEAIAAAEMANANEWNAATKTLEEIQKEWRGIGFASKKDNQKIYDRFRAACDAFFARKKEFYAGFKESINENLARKLAICEQAEALKDSTDWKATADTLIDLQKQWKEIGAVPRQKSDALWKRFRAACDSFFEARDKQPKDANDYYGNLKAKQRLIAEINAYELSGDAEADAEAGSKFSESWQAIGFVPFKEKDRIAQAYREAMAKFNAGRGASRRQRPERTPMTEKERLVKKYNQLEQDIVTYENNLGFFARSKNAEPLIRQMEERIAKAKEELRSLEAEIRSME